MLLGAGIIGYLAVRGTSLSKDVGQDRQVAGKASKWLKNSELKDWLNTLCSNLGQLGNQRIKLRLGRSARWPICCSSNMTRMVIVEWMVAFIRVEVCLAD